MTVDEMYAQTGSPTESLIIEPLNRFFQHLPASDERWVARHSDWYGYDLTPGAALERLLQTFADDMARP